MNDLDVKAAVLQAMCDQYLGTGDRLVALDAKLRDMKRHLLVERRHLCRKRHHAIYDWEEQLQSGVKNPDRSEIDRIDDLVDLIDNTFDGIVDETNKFEEDV